MAHATAKKVPHPPVGEVFELTLNGDAPENQPLAMVANSDSDCSPRNWTHNGSVVKGVASHHFRLVAVGYQRNLGAVIKALAPHGKIPEGQWREAFKASFASNGIHPVGIADPSWTNPSFGAVFPCVRSNDDSSFYWAGERLSSYWLWLVEVA